MSAARSIEAKGALRARLHPHGIDLGTGEVLPLWCGAMHYWRHPPERVGRVPRRDEGDGLPARRHVRPVGRARDRRAGEIDFGERERASRRRALPPHGARARPARRLRPGPHINAELTYFGLPERIVWDRACQARTPHGQPGDAADRADRVPGAELRERRVPRRDGAVVRARRARRAGPALARRADRARADRQRGRALLPRRRRTTRTTTPTRSRSSARSSRRSTATCATSARRGTTRGDPSRDARRPPSASTRRAPTDLAASHRLDASSTSTSSSTRWRRMVAATLGDAGSARSRRCTTSRSARARRRSTPGASAGVIDLVGARLLPPRDADRARDDPAAHDRARALRRQGSACRRTARRWARAFRRSSRRSTRRTRSTRSSRRSPTACAASTSTWRSSAIAGSARRSIRTALRAARRAVRRGSSRRSSGRASTRFAVARRFGSSFRARCDASRARATPSGRSRPRSSTSSARAGARAASKRISGSASVATLRRRGVPAHLRARARRARRAVRVRGRRRVRAIDRGREVDRLHDAWAA